MIAVLLNSYIVILALFVWLKVIPFNMFWKISPVVVLLAMKARRTVRLVLSREEDFETVRARHPFTIRIKTGATRDSAAAVGKALAERAKKAGVSSVVFDRGGYQYHGRVKALADAAREAGLEF